ncbi:hypothetical protein BBJ28_00006120 [Nothophytophthora sp. Chile5]|nr:hypothetical protein BBJ28_00006120 [Nothophytophthora sp. Chile5]
MSVPSHLDATERLDSPRHPPSALASDPGPMVLPTVRVKSPSRNRLMFWQHRRMVTPAMPRPLAGDEQTLTSAQAQTPGQSGEQDDPDRGIVFLNNPVDFDLRSFFFGRPKPRLHPAAGALSLNSASSYSSTNSCRSVTDGLASTASISTHGAEVVTNTTTPSAPIAADGVALGASTVKRPTTRPRRRLRAKEELCVVLPRSSGSKGTRPRAQKAWHLGPGFIGREPAEGTLVATRDPSMDAVHAQITVAGDDYLLRDAQSSKGTFLCLSTRQRHYPQRDGFRLRHGDVFRVGLTTCIRVIELRASSSSGTDGPSAENVGGTEVKAIQPKVNTSTANVLRLERTPSSSSCGSSRPMLKRLSTVEELRLVATDIEDEAAKGSGELRSVANLGQSNDEVSSKRECNEEPSAQGPASTPAPTPARRVRFVDTPPIILDGSAFLGSRYMRPETKQFPEEGDDDEAEDQDDRSDQSPTQAAASPRPPRRRPAGIRLAIFQQDSSTQPPATLNARELSLPGQDTYLIGSSAACDVRISASEGADVRAIHARIAFDGASFVLQDLSFEREPRRQTRVALTQRAVRLARGDWLLLGKCALRVTTTLRAFGSERRPDMKEAAMRCDVLRLSKRQLRARGRYFPVGFRLRAASGSGASDGSSGWGGSSGGPVLFGKGRDCDAQVFTTSLAVEQFSVQLERGTCLLTPKAAGINAGTYFLIGRENAEPPPTAVEAATSPEGSDVVRYASKALLLTEGCVFRCGNCELEVVYVKQAATSVARVEEQEHAQFLSAVPWLAQLAGDHRTVTNLARCGQRLRLDAGDVIYEKGDVASFLFFVLSGEVALQDPAGDDDDHASIEEVVPSGFFGDVSLQDPAASRASCGDVEYSESATATTACELLALATEDVRGYLALYMDAVRAQLRHERRRDRLVRTLRTGVSWLHELSTHELHALVAMAEPVVYASGAVMFEGEELLVPVTSAEEEGLRPRYGLLVLSCGKARVYRGNHGSWRRKNAKASEVKPSHTEDSDPATAAARIEDEDEDERWWSAREPVVALGLSSSSLVSSVRGLPSRLKAVSTVECFFLDAEHVAHLVDRSSTKLEDRRDVPASPRQAAASSPLPLMRQKSVAARRRHHSQVVTSTLRSGGGGGGDGDSSDDEDRSPLDGGDGEGDGTAARRWRRKKRNKHLLERTMETVQNELQLPNAMVLYVLAGAQRGDIHVVRNVATIGRLQSGADIEINDRHVSPAHAVIEHHGGRYWLYDTDSRWGTFVRLDEDNAVEINPGDVFLAGEVEFTCLASYPERNKPSMCCVM